MPPADPRMRGFKNKSEVADVEKLVARHSEPLPAEPVSIALAAGRVLAADITSPVSVPSFERTAMDGYALKAEDTFGAAEFTPMRLELIGSSNPGAGFEGTVGRKQAVRVTTGAPMPQGADAVLPAEEATAQADSVLAIASVPPGKHVAKAGEDVKEGELLLAAGRQLRPQDVGVLASTGLGRVSVVQRPRVDVIITGNELLPPGRKPTGHFIVDSNGPMLAALIARDGGVLVEHPIVKDDAEALKKELSKCGGDVIIVSGGSSIGPEDHAPRVVAELGELEVHGIAMRPSSPAGVGFIGGKPVFLLPGNPVACLCAYDFFAGPAIRGKGGRSRAWPYASATLPLAQKIASETGRVDYVRVRIADGAVHPVMAGGASILSSTTKSDGFVIVPRDSEGLAAGATVTVYRYA